MQKNKIYLVILGNGEIFIIQKSSGNTVTQVENLQYFTGGFFDPGYYMTGFINEENTTTHISFVIRNVGT